ncbi:MAG: trypsin-like peptidase domain-containing protein [Deltaproteobacteria bacterium]|nr:trypsin-like peptidase domain-containing protein [Deltaproteobacteria bacterium]
MSRAVRARETKMGPTGKDRLAALRARLGPAGQSLSTAELLEYLGLASAGEVNESTAGGSGDPDLEISESLEAATGDAPILDRVAEAFDGGAFSDDWGEVEEAIIDAATRPARTIADGSFVDMPPAFGWVNDAREQVERAIAASGRVELHGSSAPYGGTGFVVGDGLVLTNRHVAKLFASGSGRNDIFFRAGRTSGWDPRRETLEQESHELQVRKVLAIHPYWDAALLQVEGLPREIEPLALMGTAPANLEGLDVVVVGYPAGGQSRNSSADKKTVFGITFDVKQLMPGQVTGFQWTPKSRRKRVHALAHDASTLGGNSGSAVFDPVTGRVVGLHFAGKQKLTNWAVPAWELARDIAVRDLKVFFHNPGPPDDPRAEDWLAADPVPQETRVIPRVPPPAAPAPAATAGPLGALEQQGRSRYGRYAGPWLDAVRALQASGQELAESAGQGDAPPDDLASAIEAVRNELERPGAGRRDPYAPEIVLLPGIMGTALGRPSGLFSRLWLAPGQFLAGSLAERLSLAADGLRDKVEQGGIVPLQPIDALYGVPALAWWARGFRVHMMGYDWRKPLAVAAKRLFHRLGELATDRPHVRFVLVGHSMGGLVASVFAHQHPDAYADLVERTITLGSPLGGSFAVPETLSGESHLMRRLARAVPTDKVGDFRRMASTFPGLLAMLPSPEVFADATHAQGGAVESLYRRATWEPEFAPSVRWLEESLRLKKVLRTALVHAGRPVTNLVGTHLPTQASVDLRGYPTRGEWMETGDGTVPSRSAQVPGAEVLSIRAAHHLIPVHPKAIAAVAHLIRTGRCELSAPTDIGEPMEESVETRESLAGDESSAVHLRSKVERGAELGLEEWAWLLEGVPPTMAAGAAESVARPATPPSPDLSVELLRRLDLRPKTPTTRPVSTPPKRPRGFPGGVLLRWAPVDAGEHAWIAAPTSEDQLLDTVNWAAGRGWRLRPWDGDATGSAFGWPDHAAPERMAMLDLSHLPSERALDTAAGQPVVTASTGQSVDELLGWLEEQGDTDGYSLTSVPASGRLSVGTAIAYGSAGTGTGEGESGSHGTMGNLVVRFRAVVRAPGNPRYTVQEFTREHVDAPAFLLHLGRALIVSVSLRVVPNYWLEVRNLYPEAEALFAAEAGETSLSSLLDTTARVDVRWYPGTTRPWVRTWARIAERALGRTRRPYAYRSSQDVTPWAESALRDHAAQGTSTSVTESQLDLTRAMEPEDLVRHGLSKNLLLRDGQVTVHTERHGLVVLCPRSEVQAVVHAITAQYSAQLASFAADHGAHPMNGPLTLGVTGLDEPADLGGSDARPPALSPVRPIPDAPEVDTAVWVRADSVGGTPYQDAFLAELETFAWTTFPGRVRPDWSGLFAVDSDEGPWGHGGRLNRDILTAYPQNDAGMGLRQVGQALAGWDEDGVFAAPLHQRLFGGGRKRTVSQLFLGDEVSEEFIEGVNPKDQLAADLEYLRAGPTEGEDPSVRIAGMASWAESLSDDDYDEAVAALRREVGAQDPSEEPDETEEGIHIGGADVRNPLTVARVRKEVRALDDSGCLAWTLQVGAAAPHDFLADGASGRRTMNDIVVAEARARRRFSRVQPAPGSWYPYIGADGADRHLEEPPDYQHQLPTSLSDLLALLVDSAESGGVRVTGGSHSSSDVARPDAGRPRIELHQLPDRSIALPGRGWSPEDRHFQSRDTLAVRIPGWWKVFDAVRTLDTIHGAEPGYALENLGSYDQQTLVGAMATGTHGSGSALRPMADQLLSMDIATVQKGEDGAPRGTVFRVERADGPTDKDAFETWMRGRPAPADWQLIQDDSVFQACQIGVGSLGVIFAITVKVVPQFRLHEVARRKLFQDVGPGVIADAREIFAHAGAEPHKEPRLDLLVNPYTGHDGKQVCQSTRRTWLAYDPTKHGKYAGREQKDLIKRAKRKGPSWFVQTTAAFRAIVGAGACLDVALELNQGPKAGWDSISYQVLKLGLGKYVSPPSLEFAFPVEQTERAVQSMNELAEEAHARSPRISLTSPFGVRFVRSSKAWLAPVSGWNGDTYTESLFTMLELSMFLHAPGAEWVFEQAAQRLFDLGGRPHWGQLNDLGPNQMRDLYGDHAVDEFKKARALLDPYGVFDSPFTRRVGL